ncbi:MAG: helix-turn-helix domain-containing protein [Lachnospiraceae bacterium]|nr:helix-turn-helix domain-containing protein [Lachnospiraceae bacterium]
MLKDNLAMLRNIHGYSQEAIAEKIGISRQAYAKWESGTTIPDIEKCSLLARVYGITLDSLVRTESVEGIGVFPPAPIGKNIWGVVTINDRGQIVIPKGARDRFDLTGGQRLVVGSDERGIALIPAEIFEEIVKKGMEFMAVGNVDAD